VLRRLLDALLDCAVVSFALWTLLYCLGLPTQWSLFPSGWLWLVATVALVVWQVAGVWRDRAVGTTAGTAAGTATRTGSRSVRRAAPSALLLAGLVATAVAAVGGIVWTSGTFRVTWLATVAATACLLLWSYLDGRYQPDASISAEPGRSSTRDDLVVLGVMALTVVASLFIHLADTDDPYYVNRSVWVAEHGNAATLDTMFTPEVLNSPYGGGVPIASIESLLGVIAHMTGLRAGTVTYLVATPLFTALSVWAIWRLVRRWAPRRAVWVLVVAIAFLMLSGDSMLGNFWIVRMWQGKVMAVTFLMPLIWAYLTEVHDADRKLRVRTLALLLASGVAFFGFTPTAVVWGPVMFGVVVLAAAAVRSRTLLVGGALMVLGPIVSGLAVIAFSTSVGGEDPTALSARASFVRMLGESTPMVALALVALALAPLLARRGVAGVLAGASALVAVLVYAPGLLDLINAVTGSGPILWRMLYVAPVPVLVGLLVALPWAKGERPPPVGAEGERRSTLVRAGALVGLAAVVVGFVGGNPVWAHTGHGGPVTVSSRPEWKLDLESLDDVEILAERDIHGTVLLPPRRMKVLTMYTTKAFPVVPREWFIQNMEEPRASTAARRMLYDVAGGVGPFPSEGNVAKALDQLDVTLACVGQSEDAKRVVEIYEAAGYGDKETIGSLTCLRAPSDTAS
jgi:Family of unknown function (DUF6077)